MEAAHPPIHATRPGGPDVSGDANAEPDDEHGLPPYLMGYQPVHPGARRLSNRLWVRYGVAAAAVFIAWVLSRLLSPLVGDWVSAPFYLAVMIGAWYGGLGPGLLGTILAGVITATFFMDPPGSLRISFDDFMRLGVFMGAAVLIGSLTVTKRRAQEGLKRAHDNLESRVRARTAELQASNEQLKHQIAERRRVEAELRQSEERFRLLVEGVEDYAVFMLGADGRVASWNAAAERITGYTEAEATGAGYDSFFPAEDVQRGKPAVDLQTAATAGRYEDEGWRARKDGSRFWADVILTALRDDAGGLRGFAAVMRDVSERRELERAILEIAEREQQRIGHDLHDGLGQELTGIAFLSKALAEGLAAQSSPEAAEATEVAALVNRAIAQTRELARGLYPAELETDGLPTALQHLALRAEKLFALHCTVEADAAPAVPDKAAARHLYRVAQEAINNAVKHGRARRVRIRLASADGTAALTVTDDGAGFAPPPSGHGGMGLHLMNYRARMIGGSLDVARDEAGGGTTVSCTWPDPDGSTNNDSQGDANPAAALEKEHGNGTRQTG